MGCLDDIFIEYSAISLLMILMMVIHDYSFTIVMDDQCGKQENKQKVNN